eukprot:g83027.t1
MLPKFASKLDMEFLCLVTVGAQEQDYLLLPHLQGDLQLTVKHIAQQASVRRATWTSRSVQPAGPGKPDKSEPAQTGLSDLHGKTAGQQHSGRDRLEGEEEGQEREGGMGKAWFLELEEEEEEEEQEEKDEEKAAQAEEAARAEQQWAEQWRRAEQDALRTVMDMQQRRLTQQQQAIEEAAQALKEEMAQQAQQSMLTVQQAYSALQQGGAVAVEAAAEHVREGSQQDPRERSEAADGRQEERSEAGDVRQEASSAEQRSEAGEERQWASSAGLAGELQQPASAELKEEEQEEKRERDGEGEQLAIAELEALLAEKSAGAEQEQKAQQQQQQAQQQRQEDKHAQAVSAVEGGDSTADPDWIEVMDVLVECKLEAFAPLLLDEGFESLESIAQADISELVGTDGLQMKRGQARLLLKEARERAQIAQRGIRKGRKELEGGLYVGELKDGQACGQGKWTNPQGSTYQGAFSKDRMHGYGTYIWPNGRKYVGQWREDAMQGEVRCICVCHGIGSGSYLFFFNVGQCSTRNSTRKAGTGCMLFPNGAKYEGEWLNDERHGQGTYTYPDGVGRAVCEWRHDQRHGHGDVTAPDGSHYVGQFRGNKKHGTGSMHWPNGDKYEGGWRCDMIEGYGTYSYTDGRTFVGWFSGGLREGRGTETFPDGSKRVGQYVGGKLHGAGEFTNPDGVMEKEVWAMDVRRKALVAFRRLAEGA